MEFRVLGPLEAESRGVSLLTGLRRRERCLLGILLLEAGRIIPTSRITELLWDGAAPPAARSLLHTHVSHVRRRLAPVAQGELITRGDGYLLDVKSSDVDAQRFRALVGQARSAAEPQLQLRLLTQALELWRGPALADVATDWLRRRVCAGLTELRLAAVEARADLALQLGHHRELIAELYDLLGEHPLREGIAARLIRALYREGHQAEALEVYAGVRMRLADELGLDPGDELRSLHRAVLRQETVAESAMMRHLAVLRAPVTQVKPAQLPAAVPTFTGRQRTIEQLETLISAGGPDPSPAGPGVVVFCGMAGVGKTAVAVNWAHQLAPHYPDGQIYLNLNGHSPQAPMPPAVALNRLLRSAGVPEGQLPGAADEQVTLLRSVLHDLRALLLLDDIAGIEQVRPLLPGSPACLTIVTSRSDLRGLFASHDAVQIRLTPLRPPDSVALLMRIIGADRAAREPAAVVRLAGLCAGLPLALRVVAANLNAHPDRPLSAAVTELAGADRLAYLAIPGDASTAVRTAFWYSYQLLPAAAQRMFRLLGLAPGADLTSTAAGALAALAPRDCGQLLDLLTGAHLIERCAADRYQLHELLHAYAAELAETEETPQDRLSAQQRLLDSYTKRASSAH